MVSYGCMHFRVWHFACKNVRLPWLHTIFSGQEEQTSRRYSLWNRVFNQTFTNESRHALALNISWFVLAPIRILLFYFTIVLSHYFRIGYKYWNTWHHPLCLMHIEWSYGSNSLQIFILWGISTWWTVISLKKSMIPINKVVPLNMNDKYKKTKVIRYSYHYYYDH